MGERMDFTSIEWNYHLPKKEKLSSDVWYNSYSQFISSPHQCELNFCMRYNKDLGIDVAIRKNTWNMLWSVKVNLMLGECIYSENTETWSEYLIFPDAIESEFLKAYESNSLLVIVNCEIEWLHWINNLPVHEILPPSPMICELNDYYMNSNFSDVTVVVGDCKLPAHKIILAAQSNVLAKMLKSGELSNNQIVLEDINVELIKIVLKYLYTGRDEELNDVNIALQVLRVAEKCGMSNLKRLCEHKLLINLSVSNATMILDTADDTNSQDLRNHTMNFVANHKIDIITLEHFKQMCIKKPQLSFEIFSFMFTGK